MSISVSTKIPELDALDSDIRRAFDGSTYYITRWADEWWIYREHWFWYADFNRVAKICSRSWNDAVDVYVPEWAWGEDLKAILESAAGERHFQIEVVRKLP